MAEVELSTVVSELITYSVISACMGKVVDESGFRNRMQLNVLIVSPFGSGKSTALDRLEDMGLGFVVHDYTNPSILGSIKPSGKIVKSVLINAANRAFIIDEFQKFRPKAREALLSYMEKQWYRRPLGFVVYEPIKEEGDGWRVVAIDNYIETHVKCSFICGAMYFRRRTTEEIALLSRCFPIVLGMTKEEAYELFMGYERIRIDNKIIKTMEEYKDTDIFISNKMKKLLVTEFDQYVESFKIVPGFITRMLWDLVRIAAIKTALVGNVEITEDEVYEAVKFAPLQALGYTKGQLTMKEMEVYSLIISRDKGVTPGEIESTLEISHKGLNDAITKLLKYNLIEKVEVGKNTLYYPKGVM